MLGISDTYVAAAYLLCIASTILCIVYSILTRNDSDDVPLEKDIEWEKSEKEIEENL
ncbi:MAG: symporter small accessory protein [Verrucomicrobiia bacterium]|jgi:hypothetical protein